MKKEIELNKYKKLFKTEGAIELFLEDNKQDMEDWNFILKNYIYNKNKDSWKDLADRIFSLYIRLKNADRHMRCKCVTCWKVEHYKYIQNGHYRTRGCNKYRFSEENCHPQCKYCNLTPPKWLWWNYRNYHIYMVNRYWEKREREIREDKEKVKYDQRWYEENIMKRWKFIKWVLYYSKNK